MRDARADAVAHRRHPLTGVTEFPDVAEDPPPAIEPRSADGRRRRRSSRCGRPATPTPFEQQRGRADRHRRAHRAATGGLPRRPRSAGGRTRRGRRSPRTSSSPAGIRAVAGPARSMTPQAAAAAFRASGAALACICSSDQVLRRPRRRRRRRPSRRPVRGGCTSPVAAGPGRRPAGRRCRRADLGRRRRAGRRSPTPSTRSRRPADGHDPRLLDGRPRRAPPPTKRRGEPGRRRWRRPPWRHPGGHRRRRRVHRRRLAGLDFLDTSRGPRRTSAGRTRRCTSTQPWTIRQYAGFSTAEDSNAFYRRNLAAGQKGLSVAFDLATHRGYDSDHPRVTGDVGMAGVAIDSILDMRQLFDGIPLDEMSVSMTMNGAVLPVLALYILAAEEQGVAPAALTGTIQNDVLKEFMVRNTYIYPPGPSMRIISDIFAFTSAEMPRFNSISISGYHMQEAGATADLELAYTLADGVEYLRAGIDAGLDVDTFAPRLSFFWADRHERGDGDRQAAGRSAAVGEAGRSSSRRAATSRCRCAPTARRRAGRSPPRTSTTTSSARASRRWRRRRGTPSRCTPTPSTRRWRCRPTSAPASPATPSCFLQQESGTDRVIDPWGGSYYIERLTHDLAVAAWEHIEEVERAGGMTTAIEAGHPQAAHRGGRGAHAGTHRLRSPAGRSASTRTARTCRTRSTC